MPTKRISTAALDMLSGELITVLNETPYGILQLCEKFAYRSKDNDCLLIAVSVSLDEEKIFVDCKRHSDDVDLVEIPIKDVYVDMARSSGDEDRLLSVIRRSVVDTFLVPVAEGMFKNQTDGRIYLADTEGRDSWIKGKVRLTDSTVVYMDRKAEGDYVLGLSNSINPQFECCVLDRSLSEICKLAEQLKAYNPGTVKKRAEVNSSGLDAADIIGKVFTNLLRKAFDVTDCLVLLTQEMADHIFQLFMDTDDLTNIELPYEEGLTKDILDSHVGEYVWMESFYEPVLDICSQDEFPRPFRLMFMDQMTETSQFTLTELLSMLQDQGRIMDVYYAVRLMKYNGMQDSEIIQILSKAKLPEMDLIGAIALGISNHNESAKICKD